MSRTNKDSRAAKELNMALRSKRGGPHREKAWKICPKCKGAGNNWDVTCDKCLGEGVVYE